MNFYAQSISQTLKNVQSSVKGLSASEVARSREKHGKNTLPKSRERITRLNIFFSQFKSPLIIILLFAALISVALLNFADTIVILLTVAINTIVGFVQEDKANRALEELRGMLTYKAQVMRDGHETEINSEDLVVGDILIVESGSKIQADARLIESHELQLNESELTGESESIKKHTRAIADTPALGDRRNMVFRGTTVTNGRGRAVVTAVGAETELGKIATMVKETEDDKTPLQLQLGKMSRQISFIVLGACGFLLILGFLRPFGLHSFLELFEVAIAVAVAAIPEGMAITLTVILAIGMRHILKSRSLVRKLVAAETLGSVSVVCTDKTGTLTRGEMLITRLISHASDFDFEELQILDAAKEKHRDALLLMKCGVLCNDAFALRKDGENKPDRYSGDSTDTAFLSLGEQVGLDKTRLEYANKRVDALGFNSERKYMATLHDDESAYITYIKGAPEFVLKRSAFYENEGGPKKMTIVERHAFEKKITELSEQGFRVLGTAYKRDTVKPEVFDENYIQDTVFLGLVVLSDPLRDDVKETIDLAKRAGIRTVMITGDHVKTAAAIGAQIGLPHGPKHIFDGKRLEEINDAELSKALGDVSIFARVDPAHKIRIVRAFQSLGHVVAMTGDGINDAPALKAAAIGVALGSGTDVAKETADLVLLDDSYSTIVKSVHEGRIIYENVKKVVLYLLSGSIAELILISGSLIMGMPLALLPAQILWINLIEDSFPNMALAFDKGDGESMSEPPREKQSPILDKEMKIMIIIISLVSNAVLFILFVFFYKSSGDIQLTRTILFAGLGMASLFYIYPIRSLKRHVWTKNPFDNPYLNSTTLIGVALLVAAVYLPQLQVLLRTVPLGIEHWLLLVLFGLVDVLFIEITKGIFLFRKNNIVKNTI